jgi:hypothetical protein
LGQAGGVACHVARNREPLNALRGEERRDRVLTSGNPSERKVSFSGFVIPRPM